MPRSGGFVWPNTVVLTAAMLLSVVSAGPVHHLVGGKELWRPDYNYTDWSLNETFHVGDWLHFVYDKDAFTVLEVDERSYKNCTDKGFIFNITGGYGRDVFELTQQKTYYFLASGGYCYNGMKVAVNVVAFGVPGYRFLRIFFIAIAVLTVVLLVSLVRHR